MPVSRSNEWFLWGLLRLVIVVLLVRWAIVDPDVNNWLILAFIAASVQIVVRH